MEISCRLQESRIERYQMLTEYLMEDDRYWLNNDIWDITDPVFEKNAMIPEYRVGIERIGFDFIDNPVIKNEVKYYVLYSVKNRHITLSFVLNEYQYAIRMLMEYLNLHIKGLASLNGVRIEKGIWRLFLINKDFTVNEKGEISNVTYRYVSNTLCKFITDYYDVREEMEKDVWHAERIAGSRIPASGANCQGMTLDFSTISSYYHSTLKRYFRTIVTKKSWSHCKQMMTYLKYFFDVFYRNGYSDGFVERLTREDVEKYIFWFNGEHEYQNATYRSKFVSYIRTFLEYIQMAQYEKAPGKEVYFLIYQDDIPRREMNKDEVRKVRFIPEPVLKQLDSSLCELDRSKYIPFYILLRETGWRGTDILNLRYDNCLETVWNGKEGRNNYYLCGEITKTGISCLKIPIHDDTALMVKKLVAKAEEESTEKNNPKKYLFNTYDGRHKGRPFTKNVFVSSVQRLIRDKDIRDTDGSMYHFRTHSLRHTRAREYVEQGLGISIIQQILGHQSLQMTIHYATVAENTLYEKWKETEKLDLFRINTMRQDTDTTLESHSNNAVRYEYVRKSLEAVKVPFGVCFKPAKVSCRQQLQHCLECASFCSTKENIYEYEAEIIRVKAQIEISCTCGRKEWEEKNQQYLQALESILTKIKSEGIVHKNGSTREDV